MLVSKYFSSRSAASVEQNHRWLPRAASGATKKKKQQTLNAAQVQLFRCVQNFEALMMLFNGAAPVDTEVLEVLFDATFDKSLCFVPSQEDKPANDSGRDWNGSQGSLLALQDQPQEQESGASVHNEMLFDGFFQWAAMVVDEGLQVKILEIGVPSCGNHRFAYTLQISTPAPSEMQKVVTSIALVRNGKIFRCGGNMHTTPLTEQPSVNKRREGADALKRHASSFVTCESDEDLKTHYCGTSLEHIAAQGGNIQLANNHVLVTSFSSGTNQKLELVDNRHQGETTTTSRDLVLQEISHDENGNETKKPIALCRFDSDSNAYHLFGCAPYDDMDEPQMIQGETEFYPWYEIQEEQAFNSRNSTENTKKNANTTSMTTAQHEQQLAKQSPSFGNRNLIVSALADRDDASTASNEPLFVCKTTNTTTTSATSSTSLQQPKSPPYHAGTIQEQSPRKNNNNNGRCNRRGREGAMFVGGGPKRSSYPLMINSTETESVAYMSKRNGNLRAKLVVVEGTDPSLMIFLAAIVEHAGALHLLPCGMGGAVV